MGNTHIIHSEGGGMSLKLEKVDNETAEVTWAFGTAINTARFDSSALRIAVGATLTVDPDEDRIEELRKAVTENAKRLRSEAELASKHGMASRALLRYIALNLNEAVAESKPFQIPEEPGSGMIFTRNGYEHEFWRTTAGKWITDAYTYQNTEDLLYKGWKPVRHV